MNVAPRARTACGFRHRHEDMEPAVGFASRLARVNGRPLRYFLADMGIPTRGVEEADEKAVRTVAQLGGTSEANLLRYAPVRSPEKKRFYLANEVFDAHSIHRTYFRFCPHCVQEDYRGYVGPKIARPWLRLGWILAPIRSCPEHNILLTKTDGKVRKYQYFDFSKMMDDYRPDLNELSANAVAVPPSSFQDWLLNRIRGTRQQETWLDDVPAYAAIAFCEGLGISSLYPPKVKVSRLTEADWAQAAERGFLIASDGEASVKAQLQKLNDAQTTTKGVLGLRDTYGYVYDVLKKTSGDPGYEKFRSTFRDFATETLPLETGADVLGVVVEKQTVHSIRSAAKAANVHANTMRRIFEREGFYGNADISALPDHRVIVSNEKLEKIIEELRQSISSSTVMDHMRIPRHYLNSLVSLGHLRTVTGSDQRPNAKHHFLPEDVSAALSQMFENAVTVSEPSTRQMTIPQARSVAVTSIDFIMRLIFDGKLKWKGRFPGDEIFPHLLVDVDEVISHVRNEAKGSGIPKHHIDQHIPGMGKHVLKFIDAGALELVEEYSPDARRKVPVVSRESADAFVAKYISLGELSRKCGLHHKQVRKILDSVDVQTAFDTSQFGSYIYDRNELIAVERRRPKMWERKKS